MYHMQNYKELISSRFQRGIERLEGEGYLLVVPPSTVFQEKLEVKETVVKVNNMNAWLHQLPLSAERMVWL